jgi:hypothetical protein
MVVPLVALAILALVVIKSLMGVVAHEPAVPARPSFAADATTTNRAWDDDARSLLSPAATGHGIEPVTETNAS